MPDKEGPPSFLTFARFRLYLRVQTLMVLPPYKGAVFRGAFGSSLRRLVCMTKQSDCRPCLLRERCLYVALFEPPPPIGFTEARKFQKAPRPYVLNPPLTNRQAFRPGEVLDFELTLIGPALDALPYFIFIFQELGRRGLGLERGKYELIKVDHLMNGSAVPIYNGRSQAFTAFTPGEGYISASADIHLTQITLNFLTPLRLKEKGDLVTHLTFSRFFEHLAHRLTLLAAFYGNNSNSSASGLGPFNFNFLLAQARHIETTNHNLHWYEWERYSRRQDTIMKLGGLMGMISFRGNLDPFLLYLRLGEKVNLGQGTTFGLGKFRIHTKEESHVGR